MMISTSESCPYSRHSPAVGSSQLRAQSSDAPSALMLANWAASAGPWCSHVFAEESERIYDGGNASPTRVNEMAWIICSRTGRRLVEDWGTQ